MRGHLHNRLNDVQQLRSDNVIAFPQRTRRTMLAESPRGGIHQIAVNYKIP